MKTRLKVLLGALLLPALWFQSCASNSGPAAPAPVTVVELVTATFTSTPTATSTATPGGAATATPIPPPAVINGYFTTNENTALVLSNSTLNSLVVSSTSGDPLIFIFPGSPDDGTVSLTHAGFTNSITYMPNNGFYGVDSFAYYVHDQATLEDSPVQSMVITVNFVPTVTPTTTPSLTPTPVPAPALSNGNFTTTMNVVLTENASSVGSLVTLDPDGDSLTFSLVSPAGDGAVALNADGSFTYTPNPGFTGTDGFTVEVTDSVTTFSSPAANFTITVNP